MRSYNLLLRSQSDINVDHMYPFPPAARQERLLLNGNLNLYIEHQAILNLNQVNLNQMFWNQVCHHNLLFQKNWKMRISCIFTTLVLVILLMFLPTSLQVRQEFPRSQMSTNLHCPNLPSWANSAHFRKYPMMP